MKPTLLYKDPEWEIYRYHHSENVLVLHTHSNKERHYVSHYLKICLKCREVVPTPVLNKRNFFKNLLEYK